jgi:hypothetical protein
MTEQEFWDILFNVPVAQPIFYRAYYNDKGWVECYTMEDLPGKYIDIDQPTYTTAPYARVINGKLIVIKPANCTTKLVPGMTGTSCDPRDVCVVTNNKETVKWSLKHNETS